MSKLSQKSFIKPSKISLIEQAKKILIVLGDFNARVGPAFFMSRFHGPHNTDVRNIHGTRLVDFCYNNGLVNTNTIFPTKTFISGRGITQIRE